jgi:hypothetical protein
MKITPEHAPCSTCAKWCNGKCRETHAFTDRDAGKHCSLYLARQGCDECIHNALCTTEAADCPDFEREGYGLELVGELAHNAYPTAGEPDDANAYYDMGNR